ncbi:mannosyl-3-phosphoglycerate phosphatase, partial [Oleiphilus sp. HI0086]
LLDHESYQYAEAKALLGKLKADHIPVIFATSKTRTEVLKLRKAIKNQQPFIVENGAAVLIPTDYFPCKPEACYEQNGYWVYGLSETRQHWLGILEQAKKDFPQQFNHFAAMSEQALAELTGLSVEQAKQANEREYSEPIQWLGNHSDKQSFITYLENKGGTVLQGGRFLCLNGDHDKGRALSWLVKQFINFSIPCDLKTLAIGDSLNDVAMLELADRALIIRSPAHAPPSLARTSGYQVSEHCGPKGWAQGVNNIIYS